MDRFVQWLTGKQSISEITDQSRMSWNRQNYWCWRVDPVIEPTEQIYDHIRKVEHKYNQVCEQVKALDAQILEREAKHTALLAAYDQLTSEPVSQFTPTQWSALIDNAIVHQASIEFFFRTGRTITIEL